MAAPIAKNQKVQTRNSTKNSIVTTTASGAVTAGVPAGTNVSLVFDSVSTSTTATGGAVVPPTDYVGYIFATLNGVPIKIPYYNV